MSFITFQYRRDTSSKWAYNNPILSEGELGIETDTRNIKIGNGITPWSGMTYGGFIGNTGITGGNIKSLTGDKDIIVTDTSGDLQIWYKGIGDVTGSGNITASKNGQVVTLGYNGSPNPFLKSYTSDENITIGHNLVLNNIVKYSSVSIGNNANTLQASHNSVAIGSIAAWTNQSDQAVAIGFSSAYNGQQPGAVAISTSAGSLRQNIASVAIGNQAAVNNQGGYSVAIGDGAAYYNQGSYSVAIGNDAGATVQGDRCIGIGYSAALKNQENGAIAIGNNAGNISQGDSSIAIGYDTCAKNQSSKSISIGNSSGYNNQGTNSIAIGCLAGNYNQLPNSIVLNAKTNSNLNPIASGFYVAPVNTYPGVTFRLYYNINTAEIFYSE